MVGQEVKEERGYGQLNVYLNGSRLVTEEGRDEKLREITEWPNYLRHLDMGHGDWDDDQEES